MANAAVLNSDFIIFLNSIAVVKLPWVTTSPFFKSLIIVVLNNGFTILLNSIG